MIRIITIEREYGCGGPEIAQNLAQQLGWKLWDQLLTQEIARLANCSLTAVEQREERRDPLYYRLLKSFVRGSYEGNIGAGPVEMLDADSLVRISERVVRQAAATGNCILVGRGSQHFLQDRTDTLRFFLYAPQEEKVRRLVAGGMKRQDAELSVSEVDRERAAFIKKYFDVDWPNRTVYHAGYHSRHPAPDAVTAVCRSTGIFFRLTRFTLRRHDGAEDNHPAARIPGAYALVFRDGSPHLQARPKPLLQAPDRYRSALRWIPLTRLRSPRAAARRRSVLRCVDRPARDRCLAHPDRLRASHWFLWPFCPPGLAFSN